MEDYPWMCELCYPEGVDLGDICDGYSLMEWKGQYHILGGQGHMDDVIYTFPVAPRPDDDSDEWIDEVLKPLFAWKMDPMEGWDLVQSCLEAGFDKSEEGFKCWIGNKCGEMVIKHNDGYTQPEVQG